MELDASKEPPSSPVPSEAIARVVDARARFNGFSKFMNGGPWQRSTGSLLVQ
jgi:hypothetical protein